ncbi:MbcA/ParS/Xre antitoxin family protein [Roseateles sp. DC23W]|uniref:MbcA/ParS/Xre antitoxin family protein n=1 Tax=Pelomonas dachongensis TaxID=3299029 RepID=A0ABW7EV21_9BURK
MRALVIDMHGMPCLSCEAGESSLAVLKRLIKDMPDDVRVAFRLGEGEPISVGELAEADVRSRIGLLKPGAKSEELDDYLYVYGPDDFLIVTSNEDFGDFKDKVLLVDRNVGLTDSFAQACIRDWLAAEGLAGDFDAAMAVLGRELTRIVAGSGMPPEGWLARWLDTEHPALGGSKPSDYMDTFPRRLVVKQLLGAIASGAYM